MPEKMQSTLARLPGAARVHQRSHSIAANIAGGANRSLRFRDTLIQHTHGNERGAEESLQIYRRECILPTRILTSVSVMDFSRTRNESEGRKLHRHITLCGGYCTGSSNECPW